MIEAILVVLSNALPGREDDFNDWYTNVHIRDSLRFRGSITAQRFELTKAMVGGENFGCRYLALYDAYDAARYAREHIESALTTRMPISDSFDHAHMADFHYYPLQFRDNDPEQSNTELSNSSGVILEQFAPAPGKADAFRAWYESEYISAAMKRPGVQSGTFLVFRTYGQMFPMVPQHHFVALYRVANADAANGWAEDGLLSGTALLDSSKTRLTYWNKLTNRITEDAVLHTSAAALAEEERARVRLGDRIMKGGKEMLAKPDEAKPA